MKIIFSLIILFTFSLNAQIVTVKDAATEKPLEVVSVYSNDLNRALITNPNGQVDIKSLNKSNEIIFRLIGFLN